MNSSLKVTFMIHWIRFALVTAALKIRDFLLHSPNFLAERNDPFNKITNLNNDILNEADATVTKTFLLGNLKYFNYKSICKFWMQESTLF